MHRLLVDSDVILDLFIAREPHHTVALRFFSYLDRNADTITPFMSHVAVANVAYILGRTKSQDYAVDRVSSLRMIVHVATMTEEVIDQALREPHKDFEDSIQYFCAIENNVHSIVTRNTRDFLSRDLLVITPREFIAMDLAEKTT